jgi:hypothetical protein
MLARGQNTGPQQLLDDLASAQRAVDEPPRSWCRCGDVHRQTRAHDVSW